MRLYLMRHAHPVASDAWNGGDASRPLSPKGERQAREVIRGLVARRRLRVDAIWSSPYQRTLQTAAIAAELLGVEARSYRELRSDAFDLAGLTAILARLPSPPKRLLVVGHAPDLADLIEQLTGDAEGPCDPDHAEVALLVGTRAAAGSMRLRWRLSAPES